MHPHAWVHDRNAALLVDLYELTMLQACWREQMDRPAVFSLFARRLPPSRNYLLACGLDDALHFLETLRFDGPALDFLASRKELSLEFVDWLSRLRFTGDVYAVPEGTPVFADEPLLEVVAPMPEAQLAETFLMNQVHLQTVLASKAARVVEAARGRAVVDFGIRRMHGTDAAMKSARAFHIAGVAATSNVLAGAVYGVPISGTMAHSYIQAHDDETEALRRFAELYPDSVLLVDTYDTLEGVKKVVELARALGDRFRVRGVRIDSGDLGTLAFRARRLLDDAGLRDVAVFASGGLDEHSIADLVDRGVPVDGFGVGTAMGVARDAPALDMAYKLVAYDGRGRTKLSPGKPILPGRKQVFRFEADGRAVRDVIARFDEALPGRPLLRPAMIGGERVSAPSLDQSRALARREIDRLPDAVRGLAPADPPYPVTVSEALTADRLSLIRELTR
jgi:nicotinate phosphoribosyltransferase